MLVCVTVARLARAGGVPCVLSSGPMHAAFQTALGLVLDGGGQGCCGVSGSAGVLLGEEERGIHLWW